MDPIHGTEYVPTYEDKDGDWMLVGDVPWKYASFFYSSKLSPIHSNFGFLLLPNTMPVSYYMQIKIKIKIKIIPSSCLCNY